jgi:hypothetical protein
MPDDADMSDWKKAEIRWIEEKTSADGSLVCELIYELDEEPDSLRQVSIPKAAVAAEIRRGAAVMIDPAAGKVRAV